VVLDVLMPGLSGLDTIRELLRRGTTAAFLLSTAYERFDIARDALELGVVGYLLKPVARDKLAQALRSAAALQERRSELERKEFGYHEQDRLLKHFAASSWLAQLMLGHEIPAADRHHHATLGWSEGFAVLGAVELNAPAPEVWETLQTTLHYKSRVLCGPLTGNQCALLLPLADAALAPAAKDEVQTLLAAVGVRLAWGDALPVEQSVESWRLALTRLLAVPSAASETGGLPGFDAENDVVTAMAQGDARAALGALERLLLPLAGQDQVTVADRYRLIALLGWCFGLVVRRGAVGEAGQWFDFDDLRHAPTASAFLLALRARLPVLTAALASVPRWSPEVTQAVGWVRTHFAQPLTLETVADELSLSPKRLSRLLVDALGQGFSELLIEVRLEKAKSLLVLPGASVKSVSAACGYGDPNYFARLFKRQTGVTPSEFANLDYSPDGLS